MLICRVTPRLLCTLSPPPLPSQHILSLLPTTLSPNVFTSLMIEPPILTLHYRRCFWLVVVCVRPLSLTGGRRILSHPCLEFHPIINLLRHSPIDENTSPICSNPCAPIISNSSSPSSLSSLPHTYLIVVYY